MKTTLLFILLSFVTVSADIPDMPANLVQASIGGQWNEGDREGHIRFTAFEVGYDNVRHRIVIEWIQLPSNEQESLSVASRHIVSDLPDVWSIGMASFTIKEGVTYISFQGTNSYIPEERANFTIRIEELGKATLTKE